MWIFIVYFVIHVDNVYIYTCGFIWEKSKENSLNRKYWSGLTLWKCHEKRGAFQPSITICFVLCQGKSCHNKEIWSRVILSKKKCIIIAVCRSWHDIVEIWFSHFWGGVKCEIKVIQSLLIGRIPCLCLSSKDAPVVLRTVWILTSEKDENKLGDIQKTIQRLGEMGANWRKIAQADWLHVDHDDVFRVLHIIWREVT